MFCYFDYILQVIIRKHFVVGLTNLIKSKSEIGQILVSNLLDDLQYLR